MPKSLILGLHVWLRLSFLPCLHALFFMFSVQAPFTVPVAFSARPVGFRHILWVEG